MRVGDVGLYFYLPRLQVSSQIHSYRNFMMLCAALMDQRTQAAYSSLLSTHIPPGVNSLKALIEEAWEHGKHVRPSIL